MTVEREINSKNNGYVIKVDGKTRYIQSEPNIPYRVIANGCTDYISSADLHVSKLLESGDLLTLDELKSKKIQEIKDSSDAWRESHPLYSNCHDGNYDYYSIDEETENILISHLLSFSMEQNAVSEILTTSWMNNDNVCSYGWTLYELQTLSSQMRAVIKPHLDIVQSLIAKVKNGESKDDIRAVKIEF